MDQMDETGGLQRLLGSNAVERLCSLAIVGFMIAIALWLTNSSNSLGELFSSLIPWTADGKYNDVRWLTRGLIAAVLARLYLGAFLRWIALGKTSR